MPVLKGSLIGGRWPETKPAENRVPTLPDLAQKWGILRDCLRTQGSKPNANPASNPPKKRDREEIAQKWGRLRMGEPARDSGIPSAGRGQVRVMPPESAGSAGRIADNGGRYKRFDVRSTVCRDRGLCLDHGPAPCSADDGPRWPSVADGLPQA